VASPPEDVSPHPLSDNTAVTADPPAPEDGVGILSTLKRPAQSPLDGDEPANKATKHHSRDDLSAVLARMREEGYGMDQLFLSFMQVAQSPASSSTGKYTYPGCPQILG
jgi:hypothetical protein